MGNYLLFFPVHLQPAVGGCTGGRLNSRLSVGCRPEENEHLGGVISTGARVFRVLPSTMVFVVYFTNRFWVLVRKYLVVVNAP